MYYLIIYWELDVADSDVEYYNTKESLDARIAYLRTIPKSEGTHWVVEKRDD